MSDVEKFYYAAQAKLGGKRQWQQLSQHEQLMFVQAVNIIKGLCEV
jgi:hypothetical protein